MRQHRLLLIGFGGVGRAFADEVALRAAAIRDAYSIDLHIVAIRRSDSEAITAPRQGPSEWSWTPARGLRTLLAETAPDVVVQAVPGSPDKVEEARGQVIDALASGAHVVTATKSHVVQHWATLEEAATGASRGIRLSAAGGATLPAVDLARRGLRGMGCVNIRGSLNGTSNFVLECLAAGESLEDALTRARAAGIAEPAPSSDLSGADAAAKVVILSNLLWGRATTLDAVITDAIDAATAVQAVVAAGKGRALRAVASARSFDEVISVKLEAVDSTDPLHRLPGAEKAVQFDCGPLGSIVITGGRSSPRGAASAMLKDVLNLLTGDDRPGFR